MEPEQRCPLKTSLLYINCSIKSRPLRALIDTGAQVSIINLETVKECQMESEILATCVKKAVGVGVSNPVGFIPQRKMNIGKHAFDVSFTVMNGFPVDLLIGMDFLKNHACCIDIREKIIFIGDHKFKLIE